MANAVLIEDKQGDVVEAEYFCSDFHAKSHSAYAGWYGCVELDFGQQCSAESCSEWLHGVEQCECASAECAGYAKSH